MPAISPLFGLNTLYADKSTTNAGRLTAPRDQFTIRFGNTATLTPEQHAESVFADPRDKVFLLDFDGYLADLKANPDESCLRDPDAVRAFIEATKGTRTRVVFNSGRSLSELFDFLSTMNIQRNYPHVQISGFHGGKVVDLQGKVIKPLAQNLIDPITALLSDPILDTWKAKYPGIFIKGDECLFRINCNMIPEELKAAAYAETMAYAKALLENEPFKSNFKIKIGAENVDFDITPNSFSKGDTAEHFYQEGLAASEGRGVMLVTGGDMDTDDDMHRVALQHNGKAFHAVNEPPYRFESKVVPQDHWFQGGVPDVYRFLNRYTDLVKASQA